MDTRKLGSTGLEVAPLAFGGNVFGWTVDEATSFKLLDAFAGAGFNLIDTADSYSRWVSGHQGGESETIIGRWIARRGRDDDVIIATKVGSDMGQGLPRYQTLQPLYNLYDRDSFEGELQALCARENIGVITYFSLAAGFLTGKYRSEADFGKSARGPGMKKYLNPRGTRILDALDSVAKR